MAKSHVSIPGKLALITGAGSGIGRATALALAERGARVLVCDINKEAADQTAAQIGNAATAYAVDVADRDKMRELAATVTKEHGVLDILVNNAGVAISAGFLDTKLADWDWLLSINLMGVVHGCHFFAPAMVERGSGGHIINVSSVAGYLAIDRLNAYCTSKHAVLGFSESLREELDPHKIGVSTICPGMVNTAIPSSMRARGGPDAEADRERAVALYKKRNYGPEKVASAIVGCIEENTDLRPVTPEAWVVYALKRISPRLMRTVLRPLISRI